MTFEVVKTATSLASLMPLTSIAVFRECSQELATQLKIETPADKVGHASTSSRQANPCSIF